VFHARSGLTAAAYAAAWVAAWIVAVATYGFTNDHFGRISAARQIARYGALPFRDYFDPGYVLTELASAAIQLLLGDNLLGEILLTTSFMATGAVVVIAVARRIAPSRLSVVLAAVVIILAGPRPYDYDKVLFYPLGMLWCWRYIDRPGPGRLWGLAAGAVVAGMFRYDNGLFTLVAGVVTVVVLHGRDLRTSSRRVGVLLLASVVCAAPYIAFLQLNGGIAGAVDQMVTYAWREGARTRLARPPSLVQSLPIVSAWDVTWPAAAAANCLYWAFIALPIAASALVCRRGAALASERARALSASVMAALIAAFILREPITARLGAALAPAVIVALCIWHRAHRQWFARVIALAVILTTAVASGWSATAVRVVRVLPAVPQMLVRSAESPPPEPFLPRASTARVIDYVRRCTRPEDRIFAGWFVPELYFFSQRAFAGGMVVTFGHHWSEVINQRRIIAKMEAESVPIAILQDDDTDFRRTYAELDLYLRTHYRASSTRFDGGPDDPVYTVLARNDAAPGTTDAASSMPCFAPTAG
jgi:hypothetical protein